MARTPLATPAPERQRPLEPRDAAGLRTQRRGLWPACASPSPAAGHTPPCTDWPPVVHRPRLRPSCQQDRFRGCGPEVGAGPPLGPGSVAVGVGVSWGGLKIGATRVGRPLLDVGQKFQESLRRQGSPLWGLCP